MILKALQPFELEVVDHVVNDKPVYRNETFQRDEEFEVDICDDQEPPLARELQFCDGGVAFVGVRFWEMVQVVKNS